MKTKQFKQFFKASALALALATAIPTFVHASDEVVAVVDNSVILKSDLEASMAELKHQLESQKKQVPPEQYLAQQALEQLIIRQTQLEQVKRYNYTHLRSHDTKANLVFRQPLEKKNFQYLEIS